MSDAIRYMKAIGSCYAAPTEPSSASEHTVRRFAASPPGTRLDWLDRFLGIGWTAQKNSRFTCDCITFSGILHYPDQGRS
ncbi:MAG: hypothetical protein Q4C09_07435, partial [Atopobiaceae bacterium]|nr:hypothetical protein [Atopobiaceae bacterium]